MGGYNTPESRHNGRDRSVKVGHEISVRTLDLLYARIDRPRFADPRRIDAMTNHVVDVLEARRQLVQSVIDLVELVVMVIIVVRIIVVVVLFLVVVVIIVLMVLLMAVVVVMAMVLVVVVVVSTTNGHADEQQ